MDDNAALAGLLDQMLAERTTHVRSLLETQLHAARLHVAFLEVLLADDTAVCALVPVEAQLHKQKRKRRRRRKKSPHASTD